MQAMVRSRIELERVYARLMAGAADTPNSDWIARILASWSIGGGALPDCLGLAPTEYRTLLETLFSGYQLPEKAFSGRQVDFDRMLEKEDLVALLGSFANPNVAEIEWVIGILVAACLGSDHLWQDLGLWSRSDLSDFLHHNFPALAEKNVKDMKWKKFLYKQLCEAEGLYLCRAPSCDVCADYKHCFGPED